MDSKELPDDPKGRILQAAYEEFSDKGKAGARTQAIADRAGINKAMLNYYFTSKDQLYLEVVRSKLLGYAEIINEKMKNITDARTFVKTYIRLHSTFITKDPEWVAFIIHSMHEGDPNLVSLFEEMESRVGLRKKIQEFIDQGEIRSVDPDLMMIHLMDLSIGPYFFMPLMENSLKPLTMKEFSEKRLAAIFDLIEHGLFTKPV